MFRVTRKRVKNSSGAAAANLVAARVGSAMPIQAGEADERPLWALGPEVASPSVKSPFARGSVSGTLARTSATIRLESSARRLLTNRWSGRVKDKVPSSYVGTRAAQLNR